MGQVQPGVKMPAWDPTAASTVHGDVLKKTRVKLFTAVLGERMSDDRHELEQELSIKTFYLQAQSSSGAQRSSSVSILGSFQDLTGDWQDPEQPGLTSELTML